MANYSKIKLSGSTGGRGIKLTTTASPGDTIHTAVSGTLDMDEIWIYVANNDDTRHGVHIQWGGTTSIDDEIIVYLDPEEGLLLATPGLILNNSLIVKCWATVANKLTVFGFVNRITA